MLGQEGEDAQMSGMFYTGFVSGGDPLLVGVMGRVPADWEESGNISPLSDTKADGEEAT